MQNRLYVESSICACKRNEKCETGKYGNLNTCTCIKLIADELVIGSKGEMLNTSINISVKKQQIFNMLFY